MKILKSLLCAFMLLTANIGLAKGEFYQTSKGETCDARRIQLLIAPGIVKEYVVKSIVLAARACEERVDTPCLSALKLDDMSGHVLFKCQPAFKGDV